MHGRLQPCTSNRYTQIPSYQIIERGALEQVLKEQRLGQMDDEGTLAELISSTIESYPVEVARYRAGEEQLLQFLIGMVMKASEGTADPGITKNMLLVALKAE